jgi:cold shock CspA family protein
VIFINAYTSKDIGKNLIGYVSHYSNGMGRIKDESGNYFFFHKNDFETPNAIKLETKVSFEIGSNMKGISAVKIMPIDS